MEENLELRAAQEKHEREVDELRKRKLELKEIEDQMRLVSTKKIRIQDGIGEKRKADDVCEGDDVRAQDSKAPIVRTWHHQKSRNRLAQGEKS